MGSREPEVLHGRKAWVIWALLFAALMAAEAVMLFANLDSAWVEMYDELRHAVNGYEMVQSGDYLVNTYFGEPDYFNLKPPLSMWAIALSFKLFGFTLQAMRLPGCGIAVFIMIGATAVWMKRRYGNVASLVTLGALAACAAIPGGHYARFADPDGLYQLFFTLSMLCMLDSGRGFRSFYGCALSFGLAFMVKSWHALCIPAICLAFLALEGRLRELTWKRCAGLFVCGIAPIVPWAIARYLRDGMAFLNATVSVDVVNRMTQSEGMGLLTYFEYLLSDPMMLACLAVSAICLIVLKRAGRRFSKEGKSAAIASLLWMWIPVVLFSFSSFKKFWYVFSSFTAAAALLAGVMVRELCMAENVKKALKRVALSVVVLLCAAGIIFNVYVVVTAVNPQHYQVAMMELLDRDYDGGTHMYIQYSETNEEGMHETDWKHEDRLVATLYGDAVCLDGGAEAFEADEESAYLILGNEGNEELIDELYGWSIPMDWHSQAYYVSMFSN